MFKKLRVFAFKLVLYLAIADIFVALGFMVPFHPPDGENSNLCIFQAALTSYFTDCTIYLTSVIAHALYSAVVKHRTIEKYHLYYILFAFGMPWIGVIIPLIAGWYGPDNGWCWIKPNQAYTPWMKYLQYYFPLFLILIYNSTVYVSVIKKLNRETNLGSNEVKMKRKLALKLKMYPIVLFLCQIPPAIYRIWEIAIENSSDKSVPFVLILISGIGLSINGFLNSIVYGFTGSVRNELRKKIFGKKKPSHDTSLIFYIVKDEQITEKLVEPY
ncbi:GCR1_3 [Blepharisma stoltei]|uniref:G-protein coupled receptors family 2 profile 2 domain-containing protein n=1 Tax=Blepharisma stoltei TaxID=1481888 RepID=A0AAU9JJ30_9CILI|nr:unnamed protein product [Blepharisma stoltei]